MSPCRFEPANLKHTHTHTYMAKVMAQWVGEGGGGTPKSPKNPWPFFFFAPRTVSVEERHLQSGRAAQVVPRGLTRHQDPPQCNPDPSKAQHPSHHRHCAPLSLAKTPLFLREEEGGLQKAGEHVT